MYAFNSYYYKLSFIATGLQLYKIFKITQVSFFSHTLYNVL